jgi:hypothetical protein
MYNKKEVINFIRTMAYMNIFTAPFSPFSLIHSPQFTGMWAFANLAVLYLTDKVNK